ncbi:PIN domain-containing protein [Candidatus Pacearchaeota archaeon]|nr:PIN domain-containing protein [Candidatus Pacearchaeota archaeon]
MEEVKTLFFDTYALFEIVHASKNYHVYAQKDVSVITTKLNLMELYYSLLRLYGKAKAEEAFNFFNEFCVKYNDNVIKEACEFRHENYKRDISYIDCIGYIIAKRMGIGFLTGDEQFENFKNVEFVR